MEGEISMSSTSVELVVGVQQLLEEIPDLPVSDQTKKHGKCTVEVNDGGGYGTNNTNITDHGGVCAICLSEIELQEIALVKGCEHAYCAACILRWASYKKEPTCPQCKCPFEFLNVHRSLDGSINDFMFEESVCLLLRAPWFQPLVITEPDAAEEEDYYYNYYEDEEDEQDELYLGSFSNIRIGNRRWGDNGYVRSGRQQARPTHSRPPNSQDSVAGPSRQSTKKETVAKEPVGRRAKRALKREAADKAAAAKHQQHLARFDRLK